MSDPEYDEQGWDDDVDMNIRGGGKGRSMVSRPKERAQAKWEATLNRNWELQADADGGIEGVL